MLVRPKRHRRPARYFRSLCGEPLEPRLALAAVAAPSGLVAWWTGDGTAADSAGTNNGVLEGGTTFAPGVVGQAFSLDGIDDRIRVPNSPTLNPVAGFTIEAWIRPNWNNGERVIVSKCDQRGCPYIFKHQNFAPLDLPPFAHGKLQAQLQGAHADYVNLYGQTLYKDAWLHVTLTFDTTTTRLYLNGVLDGSQTWQTAQPILTSSTDLLIGAVFTGGGIRENFGGLIDEVKLYNRSLSADEIWADFDVVAGKAVVVDDAYIAPNGNALVVSSDGVLANDQGALGAVLVSAPVHGTLKLDNDGAFTYTPKSGFFGNDSFTYRANGSSYGIATVSIRVTRPAPSSLPSGAVAWWRGDGDANDSVGANDGTLQGTGFASGEVGQAFDFHGSGGNIGESVEVADSPNWNLGAGDFTIDLWMNLRSFNQYDDPDTPYSINPLVGQAESAYSFYGVPWYTLPYSGWGLFLKGNVVGPDGLTYGAIKLHYQSPEITYGGSWGGIDISCGFLPVLDRWYNIAVSRSGSEFTFYINGIAYPATVYNPYQPGAEAPPLPDVAAPLTMGSTIGGPYPASLNGRMDELTIFNRALSQIEIQSIYNAASAGLVIRVNAEDGAQNIEGVAQELFTNVPPGGDPNLVFATSADNSSLFSELPAIDSTGTLTFTPAPNSSGTTTVTVMLHTSSGAEGEEDGGQGSDGDQSQTFTIEVIQRNPWQNDNGQGDTSGDGHVAPNDVLLIIDYINGIGSGEAGQNSTGPYYDTSGDNWVTPLDVLTVINLFYDSRGGFGSEAVGEGESGPPRRSSTAPRADFLTPSVRSVRQALAPTPHGSESDLIALLADDIAALSTRKRRAS